ncbi:hypothetical protein BGZ61DRAFT_534554 [Ilyonectria robusta]|uniref:uncharacterized protein n=1 Tax=Ilyonectria robusta TaxID=1079257 RepID=UPI001E8E7C4A|nr:uncharacterized protein BGZ61DRAFT_534554 [Ilyonectria robusta]KAH8683864.1 hypothetical protein BGZ61DRAFT_534554 [Ilyonectria robusta]
MNLNTPLQGAHIQDPFGLTLANELWGVEYPPGTKLSRLSYALVRQVLTPDLLRKDDRLDSYILALEDKLCVFNPSWHIIRNFQHLVDLVQLLKDTWGMKRESLLPHLAAFQPKDQKLYTSIDFAVQTWLLLGFHNGGENRPPGELIFDWRPLQKLEEAIVANLSRDDQEELEPDRLFSDNFNLRDIHVLGDFVIQPTDNILQHLSVQKYRGREFRVTVFVFFYANRVPTPFINETLRTLALLLPPHEPDVNDWFSHYSAKMQRKMQRTRRRGRLLGIDPHARLQPGASRRVADYNYWRPRLLALEKAFADSSPRTLKQWWRDRRRTRDWATFWVAALALLLALLSLLAGLVSTVFGALSWEESKVANSYASGETTVTPTSSCCCCGEYSGSDGGETIMARNYTSATGTVTETDHIFTQVVTVTAWVTTTRAWTVTVVHSN